LLHGEGSSPRCGVFLPQRAQRLRKGRKGFAPFAVKKHNVTVKVKLFRDDSKVPATAEKKSAAAGKMKSNACNAQMHTCV
jgi:hypothetical protein